MSVSVVFKWKSSASLTIWDCGCGLSERFVAEGTVSADAIDYDKAHQSTTLVEPQHGQDAPG